MKIRNGLAAVIALSLALTGCGSSTGSGSESKEMSAEDLIKLSGEAMAEVKSMSASMVMEMSAEMEGDTLDMVMTADMDTIYEEPIKLKMDMSVTAGDEEAMGYSMYAVQDGDTMNTYMNLGDDQWYNQQVTIEDMSQYNAQSNTELYLSNISSFTADGKETVNGVEATVISGVLAGDSMKEAIMDSGMESITGSLGEMTEEEIDAVISEIGDMPVKLWISDEGYVMKYELDMTEMMQKLMITMVAQAAGVTEDEVPMTVSKMVISMTCDNYNAVEDFDIPEEALAA